MTFTKVDYPVPRGDHKGERPRRKDLAMVFDEFMAMQIKAARLGFNRDEYKDDKSAAQTLRMFARNHNLPIRVLHRMNDVYFVRTDM